MRESNANTMNRIAAVIAVGCFALVAGATDYYWRGGASGDWDKYYNWSLTPGGTAASTYPSNYAVDQATISSDAAITLPAESNANVSNLIINANVELKDGSGKIHAKTISGSGKLTMRAGTCFYASEYCTTVSVDVVEIPAGERVNVSNTGKGNNYGYGVMFTADCALTGSGTIVFDSYIDAVDFNPVELVFPGDPDKIVEAVGFPTIGRERQFHLTPASKQILFTASMYARMPAPITSVETPLPEYTLFS